jgi:hypothetical protein
LVALTRAWGWKKNNVKWFTSNQFTRKFTPAGEGVGRRLKQFAEPFVDLENHECCSQSEEALLLLGPLGLHIIDSFRIDQ